MVFVADRMAVLDAQRATIQTRIRPVGAGVMTTAAGQGFVLYRFTGIAPGVTPGWSVNDGRVGLVLNDDDGVWELQRLNSAVSPGRITGTVTAPPALAATVTVDIIDAVNPARFGHIFANAEVPSYYTNDRMYIDAMRTCDFHQGTLNKHGIPTDQTANSALQTPSSYNEAATLNTADAFIYDAWIEGPGTATLRIETGLSPEWSQLVSNGSRSWTCTHQNNATYNDRAYVVLSVDNPSGFTDDTRVHFVRRDLRSLFDGGRRVNPVVIDLWKRFSGLRDMDMQGINGGTGTEFVPITYKGPRVSGETIVEICNLANIDLWHCIQTHFADDAVTADLTWYRDRIAGRIHVEWSNETWNTFFESYQYCYDQGQFMFPDVGNQYQRATYFAGYRKTQVALIALEVFDGDRDRLVNVLAFQTNGFSQLTESEAGARKAGVARLEDVFDILSPGGYARGSMTNLSGTSRTAFLQWVTDKNYQAFADEYESRTVLTSTDDDGVDNCEALAALMCAEAARRGMVCFPYEAAHHVVVGAGGFGSREAEVSKFVNDAFDAAPMLPVFRRQIEAFIKPRGGAGFGMFTLTNIVEKTCWGATNSPYRMTGKARLEALFAVQADASLARPALQLAVERAPLLIGVKAKSYLKPSGGSWPYTIEVVSGTLPPGMVFDGHRGESGTPLGSITPGTSYTRRYRVTDARGATATLDVTSVVAAAPPSASYFWIDAYARRGPLNPSDFITLADLRYYGPQGQLLVPAEAFVSTGTAANISDGNRATTIQGVPIRAGHRFASAVQVAKIVVVNGLGGAHEGPDDLAVRYSNTASEMLSPSAGSVAMSRAQSSAVITDNSYTDTGEQELALPYGAT